jgi:hypothetical protein
MLSDEARMKNPLTPLPPLPGERGTSRCAPGALRGTAPVGRGQPGARSAFLTMRIE